MSVAGRSDDFTYFRDVCEHFMRMAITISKSRYLAGCQCLKRLYLQVHQPKLVAQPGGSGKGIIEQGREVGLLARELFPGGVEVDGSAGLGQAIGTTKELVA